MNNRHRQIEKAVRLRYYRKCNRFSKFADSIDWSAVATALDRVNVAFRALAESASEALSKCTERLRKEAAKNA